MNIHKNARLTFIRRVEMVEDVLKGGLSASYAAQLYGVSAATVRKWVGRFLAEGHAALTDRSSRPVCSPRTIDGAKALTKVIRSTFGRHTPIQRCQVHKARNMIDRLPKDRKSVV